MKRTLSLLLAALLLCCGCAPSVNKPAEPAATEPPAASAAPAAPASGEVLLLNADLTRAGAGDAAAGDAAAALDFSLSLFARALAQEGKNPVISPISAYLCLAMAQNGADAETLAAFERVLGADTDTLNAFCRALADALQETAGDTKLSLANSAWADAASAALSPEYLQAVTDAFGAELYSADLDTRETLDAVNAWVSGKTNGLIPTLRDAPYSADTVLVLLNTLYFKAVWQDAFRGWQTRDDVFTDADGNESSVPFMHVGDAQRNCIVTPEAQGIVLPYNDGKTAFLALKPASGDARAFAQALTPEAFAGYLAAAADTLVDLALPKFTVEYGFSLNEPLADMGLAPAFDAGAADFTRMGTSSLGALYLSSVLQKVKIEVNEKGTEAAAVTEAAMAGAAFTPEQPLDLRFDRPFVYAVVDLASGLPLFIGVYETPAA